MPQLLIIIFKYYYLPIKFITCMKTLISLFIATFICVASTFADDAAVVANWKFPVAYWFPNGAIPTVGIANYPRAQMVADSIGNFDAAGAVFDEVWTSLTKQGNGYSIANTTGNPASHTGPADFTGAMKVVYDQNNIYILLKYTDDDITGKESVELMWAPDLSIPAIAALPVAQLPTGNAQQAPYSRYGNFGGYKATYSNKGYSNCMIVDFNAAGTGNINWAGTNTILTQSLSYDDKTDLGSHDVKAIYTIGYQALTGNAYPTALNGRPNFTPAIWRLLNSKKGISFDIHIIDDDANDALNTATPAVKKPQEYWWNSTNNDGYAQTYYSGFIAPKQILTDVNSIYSNKPAIFAEVTSTQIKLTQNANVVVFNSVGKRVLTLKETNNVDLTDLKQGVYIIRANNETLKFVR
jgi:hypothetical protein